MSSRESWVTRVTGQVTDRSRGSWVIKCDPLSALLCICLNFCSIRVCRVNSYQLSHTLLLYLVYALPAWGGFLSAELTNKINALFRRLKRFGYTTCNITVSDLIDTSGRDLFRKLSSSEHYLHHLLPPERKYSNLRNRGHPYELPEYCTNLHKKSFIIQSLYLYI